jgi:hypothetical protein
MRIADDSEESMENLTTELLALELWIDGNPDVTYFDPFFRMRLNGIEELREHDEGLRGRISADSYEIIDPRVVGGDDFAVLSFNFEAHAPSPTAAVIENGG